MSAALDRLRKAFNIVPGPMGDLNRHLAIEDAVRALLEAVPVPLVVDSRETLAEALVTVRTDHRVTDDYQGGYVCSCGQRWDWQASEHRAAKLHEALALVAALLSSGVVEERTTAERPEIVVLCGSTRFYDEFQQANYDLTMQGKIVLSVGFYPHAKAQHGHGEGVGHDSAEKVALDELHKRKIDLADRVLVLNVGGYIGDSTRSEVAYAESLGRPIDWLESVGGGSRG